MGTTLTLRPSTAVCEGLQSLLQKVSGLPQSLCSQASARSSRVLSQGSEQNNVPQLKASAVSSVDLFLLSKKNCCRWKSVVVFGKRINKIFHSDSLWGT